jgi:hypothetical protein
MFCLAERSLSSLSGGLIALVLLFIIAAAATVALTFYLKRRFVSVQTSYESSLLYIRFSNFIELHPVVSRVLADS